MTAGGPAARLSDAPDQAWDPALDPARQRFRGLIVARVLAFEAYRSQAAKGEDQVQALTGIGDLAHKISGVSGTLGFARMGRLAATVERVVIDGTANRSDPARLLAQLDPHLEELLTEMEERLDD